MNGEATLGLYDPRQRTSVVPPRALRLPAQGSSSATLIRSLNNLIEQHSETPIRFQNWRGETIEKRLTEQIGHAGNFPRVDYHRERAANVANFPLAEVWLEWWAGQSADLREPNDFGLYRLTALLFATDHFSHRSQVPSWIREIIRLTVGETDGTMQQSTHRRVAIRVVEWLCYLVDPHPILDTLLDLAEQANQLAQIPPLDERGESLFSVNKHWQFWLRLLARHRQQQPNRWQDRHHIRYWQLLHWLDQPEPHYHRCWPDFETLIQALVRGAANEHDLYDQLIGRCTCQICQTDENAHRFLRDLDNASQRHPNTKKFPLSDHLYVQTAVENIRRRVVELERQRDEIATAASSILHRLSDTGGIETMLPIVAALGNKTLVHGWTAERESRAATFAHLIRASSPRPNDTIPAFITAVQEYDIQPKQLLRIALFAPQWARHIEAVIGWPKLAEAVWWLHAHLASGGWQGEEISDVQVAEIRKRTVLTDKERLAGAVDVAWFWRVYHVLGAERWAQINKLAKYTATSGGHKRAQLFADALLGKLDEIALLDRVIKKRYQDGVRAIGLLPLPDAERDEVLLRRYLALQNFLKSDRKIGSQRRANEKQAVEIGLANLARTAGYLDPQRLQWAMEQHAVADLAQGAVAVTIEETTVTLSIDFLGEPQLAVNKNGRTLKNIPAKLKKQPAVMQLIERRKTLRQQVRRMRQTLEAMMVRGEMVRGAELQPLFGHPLLQPLLEDLLFVSDDGVGYVEGTQLVDYAGEWVAFSAETSLRIAHPHDLYLRGDWHLWQRDCFRRERIQPFKQIFRELYVVTPAELTAGTHSARYAGQLVYAGQASALLGSKGWVVTFNEPARRSFPEKDLTVWLNTSSGYYFDSSGTLTLDTLHFTRQSDHASVPLADVPARIFSTVMRDLDLVVSVAHAGGVDPEATVSTVELRGQMVMESAELLKLTNVHVDGNRVWIDGSRNRYTVHLGSGVIHQQPGGYLCIVPVSRQRRGRIFLPFVDDDPKSAEIIAKVMMLARDEKIKDPTILQQIQTRVREIP